jgi:hypothetical protein
MGHAPIARHLYGLADGSEQQEQDEQVPAGASLVPVRYLILR